MNAVLQKLYAGDGLLPRIMRSASATILGFGAAQALRLAGNLITTRLLFPEAFGLMALVAVILQGLAMFSDVGITPSILQSKRGDDPTFLDTAWTLQVFRGVMLWGVTCLIAWPVAQIYGAPELLYILPVSGLTLLIAGFTTTRVETANRHLQLGHRTTLELAGQVIGLVAAIFLAWLMQSVWAIVISNIIGTLAVTWLYGRYLDGHRNSFGWEKAAAHELVHFGKWIFLSTIAGFVVLQADKLILGRFLTLAEFGVYNIGFFLASFPMMMGRQLVHRLMIPIYREIPPGAAPENFGKLRKMRFIVSAGMLALIAFVGLGGVWLVDLLYDPRYVQAGAITVLIALMTLPQVVVVTYDQAALAQGNSRGFFMLTAVRALALVGCLLVGITSFGLPGAILGSGVAVIIVYPATVWLARSARVWDPLHDVAITCAALALAGLALWVNSAALKNWLPLLSG